MFIVHFKSKRQSLKTMHLFWCTSGFLLNYVVLIVLASDSKVYPVYPNQRVRSVNSSAMDLVVGTVYKVRSMEPHIQSRSIAEEVFTDANANTKAEEDVYLVGQRELCKRNMITSCWTYNALAFAKNLLQPLPFRGTLGRSMGESDVPHLVGLPIQGNGTYSILGRSSILGFGDIYLFLERQASKFIQGHGVLFPASSWEDAVAENFQQPIIMNEETSKDLQGFFRVCRPPFTPPFGIAPAGLLQDVSDSRGEFSTLYNSYANPYRDMHGYRNRDYGRYVSEAQRQPAAADATQADY